MKPCVRKRGPWWRVTLASATVGSYGTWERAMSYVQLIHEKANRP